MLRENISYKNIAVQKQIIFQVIVALVRAKNINHITLCAATRVSAPGAAPTGASLLMEGGGKTNIGWVYLMPE